MVLILQALIAVAVNTALVTVVWLRYRSTPAAWFFMAMLVLRSAIAINAQILHPTADSARTMLVLGAVRWGLLGLLQGMMLFFFVAIYEPAWLRRMTIVVPAATAHLAVSALLSHDVLRSNDHLLLDHAALRSIDHGAVQAHGVVIGLFSAAWMPIMLMVIRTMIREPGERPPLTFVLATMIAASIVGSVAAKRAQIGYASIVFDVLLSGLLAYLLFRHRVFETKKIAIERALEGMDEGIAVVSAAGRVLFANSAMERRGLLHGAPEDGRARDDDEDRPSYIVGLLRKGVGSGRAEGDVQRGDRTYHLSASPILDAGGRLHGHLLLARDTSEARAYERELVRRNLELEEAIRTQREASRARATAEAARASAEAANNAKTAFLANMSHELRTPLNAILGFVQLLERDSTLGPSQRESLGIIGRSGEHLLGLINDVLEISKIEAGRLTLNEGPFDLRRLLLGIEEMFEVRARAQGLQFAIELEGDVPRHVIGDEGKLRQVLINLVGNAFKFTKAGRVDVRARRLDVSGEITLARAPLRLVFEVADTGAGIDPAEQQRLFKPFVQAGKGTSEGTGLGLAISDAFVALMGGAIQLTSCPGEGTTFTFDVLMTESEPAQSAARGRGSVVRVAPGQRPYRVLVADDQWENRELMIRLLTSVGFEVRGAENGLEAVDLWQSFAPDLIWMDMRMPELDGYQATRRIKAAQRGGSTVIIALTASAFEHDREEILAAGCDDFVRKPAKEADIFSKMEALLGVRFIYSSDGGAEPAPEPEPISLRPADLARLPESVVAELRAAAEQLNTKAVTAILERIRPEHAPVADAISALVSAYRFDTVLMLVDPRPPT